MGGRTYACPRVIVLKTLKTMTPIGLPGIMNPAKKGDNTLRAKYIRLRFLAYWNILTKLDIGNSVNHASRNLSMLAVIFQSEETPTINTMAIITDTKNPHPVLLVRINDCGGRRSTHREAPSRNPEYKPVLEPLK